MMDMTMGLGQGVEEIMVPLDESQIEAERPPDPPYWAANPDVEKLVDGVQNVADRNDRRLNASPILAKILRSIDYFYGFFGDDYVGYSDTAITLVGPQGQILSLTTNEYGYLLGQLVAMVTSEFPTFQVAAHLKTERGISAAKLGRRLTNYYLERRGLKDDLVSVVEDGVVSGMGFMAVTWDVDAGNAKSADDIAMTVVYEGDIRFEVIPWENVLWDYEHEGPWRLVPWVAWRRRRNRFDAAAQYPDVAEAILRKTTRDLAPDGGNPGIEAMELDEEEGDDVWEWHFYHRPTNALPFGRHARWIGDAYLDDGHNPYASHACRGIPVYQYRTGRVRRSCFGWGPGFNIQKEQEALNALLENALTRFDALAYPMIWRPIGKKASPPRAGDGGVLWVESEVKPEMIDFVHVPEEVFALAQTLVLTMERKVALSAAAQGQAQSGVRANRMQLFAAEKSRQFNHRLFGEFYGLFQDVGTAILDILKTFGSGERAFEAVGEKEAGEIVRFVQGDLDPAVAVVVTPGPSILRTLEGRVNLLELMGQLNVPLTREDVVAITEGESLATVTDPLQEQRAIVEAENEALLAGGAHQAIATDDHLVHIRGHVRPLNMPEVRANQQLAAALLAAAAEHVEIFMQTLPLGAALKQIEPDVLAMLAGGLGGSPENQEPAEER